MTKYYDIDTSVRINGGLTINGDTSIPSSFNLYLGGGNITVTGNIIATSNISGNHTGTGSSLTVNGTTSNGGVNPISNGWAYTHENKTGSQGHIPTGGTGTTFLRGDNTWVIPTDTNNYTTGMSSTSGGNGTLTLNRSGLSDLTLNLSHTHAFSTLTSIPTTLGGYGITDGAPKTLASYGTLPSVLTNGYFQMPTLGDKLRWRIPTLVEYFDGTIWQPWSTNIFNVLTDARGNTTATIDYTHANFRLTYSGDSYGTSSSIVYVASSYNAPSGSMTVESSPDNWTTINNRGNALPMLGSYWRYASIADSNADTSIRFTFNWSLASGNTFTMNQLMLFTARPGEQGASMDSLLPLTWDVYKNLSTTGNVTAGKIIGDGTQLTVNGTAISGSSNPINSGWAYTHTNTTGIGSHVPTGGTASTFLRGDGTWVTPTDTNNYDSGISSTSGGNGTLTISRNGLSNLTLDLTHNHDSSYYTKAQIDTSLSGKDYYGKWTLNANGTAYAVNSSGNITITGNGATSVTMSNGTVTISSTDNNTWRPIDTTPTSGDTTNSISSDWAYSHSNTFGMGAHVPSGGNATTFLRGDNTWVTPTDTYVNGISSTSGGNGTLTVSRNNGSNLTLDLSHNHNSLYLGINATAVNSTLFNNLSSNQFVRNDTDSTMNADTTFSINNTSYPIALSTIGVAGGWARGIHVLDTGNSVIAGAGFYGNAGTLNSFAIKLSNNWWVTPNLEVLSTGVNINGNKVWHSGNMGSGSNLDADKLDGHDSTYFVYKGQYNLFDNMSGGATYDQVDFNTLGIIGEYRFINLGGSGTVNKPVNENAMGYYFGMGGGDVGSRGFQLLGTSTKNLYFRDLSNNVWCKTWNDQNMGAGSGLNSDMVDSIQGSQLVRNDLANQTVDTGFTMSSNAYVGMSNGSGALYVRTGAGAVGIQLAGDNSAPQSGVGSYLNANGTATFTGTMTANAIAVSSTSLVANLNATMINSVKEPQLAKNTSISEISGKGVYTGLSVQAQSVPNMTVQINIGTAYTDSGMRVTIGTATSVSFSAPSATYNRIDTVYMQGSSAGANEGVITVMTGTAQSSPVPPAIPSDAIQLANVTVRQNAGSILSTDITDMRLWKPFYNSSGDTYVRNNLYIQGSLNSTNGFISLSQPIKNTAPNNSVTISAGSTSYTWTHNLNLARYVVRLSWNNLEPHVTWSNKTTNAITINLDNAYDTDTIVDISIEAF